MRKNILTIPVDDLCEEDVIYDWNKMGTVLRPPEAVSFFDETLRDGIQCPSVVDPPIEDKLRIVHLMDELGIQYADIGLPGSGPRAAADVTAIVREIRDAKLKVKPAIAARTVVADIQPAVEISQQLGVEIEVMAFIGSSSIRLYAEQWDLDRMLKMSATAIDFCLKNNLPCCYVTEDTARSQPEVLRPLFLNAIEHGAHRLCLCDTVGHATPDGVKALVSWTKALLIEEGAENVLIDWHGHDDRGLGLVNAMLAAEFGAERIHGTALGIGERVGNTALDQVLLNMKLLGWIDNDLSKLVMYGKTVANATRMPIPVNYPLLGSDAFRTGTGVHAAAVIKAERRGHTFLSDRIYSGVPASWFGKSQEIEIGHMSGESNVVYWLEKRQVQAERGLVERIFAEAKGSNRLLSDDEILQVIDEYRAEQRQRPTTE